MELENGESPISTCIICVLAVTLNGSVLCLFSRKKNLRTPFGIHLIFLLSYNFIFAIIQNPLDVVNNLYPYWTLSAQLCSLHIYQTAVVGALTVHSHLLITLNRVWTTTIAAPDMPTRRSALISCISICAYVHIVLLPGCILDALYYRPTWQTFCYLNGAAQPGWSKTILILAFFLPEAIILGAYPYIWYKRRSIQKMRRLKFKSPGNTRTFSLKPVLIYPYLALRWGTRYLAVKLVSRFPSGN